MNFWIQMKMMMKLYRDWCRSNIKLVVNKQHKEKDSGIPLIMKFPNAYAYTKNNMHNILKIDSTSTHYIHICPRCFPFFLTQQSQFHMSRHPYFFLFSKPPPSVECDIICILYVNECVYKIIYNVILYLALWVQNIWFGNLVLFPMSTLLKKYKNIITWLYSKWDAHFIHGIS